MLGGGVRCSLYCLYLCVYAWKQFGWCKGTVEGRGTVMLTVMLVSVVDGLVNGISEVVQ